MKELLSILTRILNYEYVSRDTLLQESYHIQVRHIIRVISLQCLCAVVLWVAGVL